MVVGHETRVRSGVLAGATELLAELGGDPAIVRGTAGLTAKALQNPDTPIPATSVVLFLEAAARNCRCPAFGLHLAQRQQLALFGPLSGLFESAATIRELLVDLARYFPLHTQGALVALEAEGPDLVLTYELAAGVSEARRQVVELGLGIVIAQIRLHAPGWVPEAVWLRHAPPVDPREHRQRLGNAVTFNADRNGLLIDAATLAQPTLAGNAQRHGAIAAGFEQARRTLAGAVRTRAEIVIRALLPFAPCDLAATAATMRLSRRTLQRRLAADGISFEEIVDRVRADLALSYLSDSDLTAGQIAEILQLSQSSVLARACRRWYGKSPRELRRTAPRS